MGHPGITDGILGAVPLPVLLFRPEMGAESPLWEPTGSMVGLATLGLSDALAAECEAWARDAADDDTPELVRKGFELFNRLRVLLDPRYNVTWDGPLLDPVGHIDDPRADGG